MEERNVPGQPQDPQEEGGREDEFRRRLKDLGYLENPLEKFFIGGAHGRTGVLVANLKVAIKVGVLGGVFLGVVTALGLGLVSRESLTGPGAISKLAAYFAIVFTGLFTVLELAICLVVTGLGKAFRRLFTRTEMIALYSGIFAGLVTIVYGTAWWWAGAPEGEFLSGRSAGAFAVIAILAAFIGLLTRLAVRALLATLGGADLTARGKGRATKLYFAVLVCGVVVFAGYRMLTAREVPVAPAKYEVTPTDLTVTLIAIDGATIDFLNRMIEKGECPNLAALAAKGYVAPLAAGEIRVNPSVWTTVATGVTPAKHGVTSYSGQEIAGLGLYVKDRVGFGLYDALLAALPAVGLSRRAALQRRSFAYPALWDVIAEKGDLSGVVNWWGTWPADDFHGFLVTDRMYAKLQVAKALGGEPEFEKEIYPRVLFDAMASYPLTAAKVAEEPLAAAEDMDRFAVAAALAGAGDYPRLSLVAVYLPGLDIYENTLYSKLSDGFDIAHAAGAVEAVTEYWRFLDGIVGPIAGGAGPKHVVIVAGDPGMAKGERRSAGKSAEEGFVIISGGPAARGRGDKALRAVDIAPAVLYLLGFPISREMDGGVPTAAFDEAFVKAHPVAWADTFGRLAVRPEGRYSVDSQLVDRLRSLGYLQ